MKNFIMKLARTAMTLLLLLVTSTTSWAQNKFVLAYTPDPNFVNQYNIPGQEFSNYGYRTYQETRGEAITVMGCPIWTGHTFTHWFAYWTKQDGTFAYCDFYKDDVIPAAITNEISTDNPVLTLQAVFVKNDYTLTFDANGGTGAEMADMPMTYTDSYTLPACTYSKSGAVFMGWTTNADGTGNFFCDGDRVSNMTTEQHGNVTLYAQYLETTGTADDPYLIGNAPTWNILAGRVNKGIDSYKYYKMTANIETGRMMGTTAHPFCGHFDGNGHSLRGYFSLNLNEIENDTYAPFKYVKNATFINLRITSDIYVDGYKPCGVSAGGCVGAVMPQGNVNFVACHSSARGSFAWSSNNNGDMRGGSFGGFISFLSATSSATFLDCLSSAEAYWYPYQVGYFIGVAEGGSNATFTNCFESTEKFPFQYYNGEVTKRIYVPQYPFVALPNSVNETYNNCWRRMCDDCDMLENEPPGTYAHQGTYTDSKKSTTLNSLGNGWVRDRYGDVFPRIPANTNSITISSDIVHGTVASLETAVPDQDVMLSVTPEDGYHITSVTYNDGSDHDATLRDGKYWFTMPGSNVTVSATFAVDNDAVQYVAYNTESRMYETKYFKRSSVTNVTSSSTNLGTSGQEKKYVVTGDVTVSDRIYVNGTVHLVLADGATLTANKGINVHSGNSLIVYGQEGGTGTLNATGCKIREGDNWESAAIGSDGNGNGNINAYLGDLTFHSGVVNATGYANAAGIGGGRYNPESGSITIYGGTISAKAINTFNSNPIAQAIGCGASGTIVSKSIADGLRVYTNNSTTPTLVEYAYRQQNGLSQTDVRVERCTEHNYSNGRCSYCGAYEYHQITYNGNGNTGGTAPEVATCNVTTGIHSATGTVADAGTLERTGYSFAGWNTEADGSGTAYAPDETITLTSSITLYAQWSLITYTITYDLAGGYEPTLPNPDIYTVESGDITLNNPTRVDIDEVNSTTTNYLFMGWTGTGLDEPTKTVIIPHGSTGDRSYTATWDVSDIPFEGIEIDHYAESEVGRYYINMPYPGWVEDYAVDENGDYIMDENGDYIPIIAGAEETPKIVNIPEWFTSAFKVYDDGGKDNCAQSNPSESHLITLILNAPEGKAFSVQGKLDIGTWYDETDWLKIYDGTGTDHEIHCATENEFNSFITSSNSIRFDLHIENGHYFSNMDLIVAVIDAPIVLNLVENSLTPNGATVEWTGPSESYILEIAEGTPDGEESALDWTTVDNDASPYTFDNLDFETTYSVRVIGTQPDRISNILSFTTLERCPVPTNLEIVENSLSAYGATVSWTGFSDNYNIKLGEVNYLVNADFETGSNLSQGAFTFTTTSSYPWTVVENSHSGSWCAKSTNEGVDGSESEMVLEVTLATDETLTFSAKVSSEERYDKAYFSIDGCVEIDGISGEGEWIDYSFPLTAGTHTLRWYYIKDGSEYSNYDCFYVDDIRILDGFTEVGTYRSDTESYALTGLSAGKTYKVQVQADGGTDGTSQWSSPIMFTTTFDLILANAADNSDAIEMADANGGEFNVTLAGRTLWKDGDWNTLCLPFNLTIAGSPLDDDEVEVRTLSSATFENGKLTLNFTPATGEGAVTELQAGTPYIIKWTSGSNLTENDLRFTGVTIDATARNQVCDLGDGKSISFVGTYSPVVYNDANKHVLFLGSGSTLYYPDGEATTINACRAYFMLNGITAGEPQTGGDVKAFVLNFGDQTVTSIQNSEFRIHHEDGGWYTVDGRKLEKKPTQRGIYIHNGTKVAIK